MSLHELIIFMGFGLGQEVFFTALFGEKRSKLLMGYSSIWYLPLYALAPIGFEYALPFISHLSWFYRGAIYTLAFLIIEFVGMGLIKLLIGKSPSEDSYNKSKWGILGLTNLEHAPAYFISGLILEWLFKSLN